MTDMYLLSTGRHERSRDGRCAMEWTAYLAGEPHSDHPACVSPLLTEFCIQLNDALPDGPRQRLRPYLARTIGTRGDGLDGHRSWLCTDWLIREYTPAFLDLSPSLRGHAAALRAAPLVLGPENLARAMENLNAARDAAGAAAWTAAGAAAWVAARDAAWAAARDAAWAAARDAAWAAARDALASTVVALQDSILRPGGLLDRMLPTEPLQLPVVADAAKVCGAVA